MEYIDYTYYTDTYKGSSIPVAAFNKQAMKAQLKVDYFTFNRIDTTADYMERVKMCCCDLAEQIYTFETAENMMGNVSSEKVGDYSISFNNPVDSASLSSAKMRSCIYEWLSMTGLLYRGLC
jgi:hypothetical protein